MASRPSAASPTTSKSGWRSSTRRRPVRMTAWSSASRTRMRSGLIGQDDGDGGAASGFGIDVEAAADAFHAFLHTQDTGSFGVAGMETRAIDLDSDADVRGLLPDGDRDVDGAGVAGGVMQGLLDHAVDRGAVLVGKAFGDLAGIHPDLHTGAPRHFAGLP